MKILDSLLLWLPSNQYECDEAFFYDVNLATLANDAILDFCDRKISFEQMLEVIDYYDSDVDDYCQILDANLRAFGA